MGLVPGEGGLRRGGRSAKGPRGLSIRLAECWAAKKTEEEEREEKGNEEEEKKANDTLRRTRDKHTC